MNNICVLIAIITKTLPLVSRARYLPNKKGPAKTRTLLKRDELNWLSQWTTAFIVPVCSLLYSY